MLSLFLNGVVMEVLVKPNIPKHLPRIKMLSKINHNQIVMEIMILMTVNKIMNKTWNIPTDANMFLFYFVPLRLTFSMTDSTNDILWKNLTPSRTRYCRSIQFLYKKETKYNTCKEVKAIEDEIKSLVPIEIVINNISVPIHCKLVMTMIDGKVINNLTDTSSQRCFICNCGPKNMNDTAVYTFLVIE